MCAVAPSKNDDEMEKWARMFPSVLNQNLGKARHYRVESDELKPGTEWGHVKPRSYSAAETQSLRPFVEELVNLGVVESVRKRPSLLTPMMTVAKADGQRRLVHDFRLLNSITRVVQNNGMDRNRVLASLPKRAWWTTLDLTKGFQQIEVAEDIRDRFGFEFDNRWWRFARCPFGWVNSMQHFTSAISITIQRARERLAPDITIAAYVDDIIIGADDEAAHDLALRVVFEELSRDGWTVNPAKVKCKCRAVDFLGHRLDEEGIKPAPGLIRKVKEMPQPTNCKELRTFFGVMHQLEKFQFSQHRVLRRLREYLKKGPTAFATKDFSSLWRDVTEEASGGVATLGFYNPHGKLEVYVDASGDGVGAVLLSDRVPVCMFSRRTRKGWKHSADSEIDGILKALQAFEIYTGTRPVQVYTDNWCAYTSLNPGNLGAPVMRRLDQILAKNPLVTFVPGKDNELADMLSRRPYLLGAPPVGQQVCAVEGDLEAMITETHNRGHIGCEAVVGLLRRRGIAPKGLRSAVAEVVARCPVCQFWKPKRANESLGRNEARRVSDVVGIDFLGPMKNASGQGHKHLAVAVDGMSRFAEAIMVDAPTSKAALKLLNLWQRKHGKVTTLLTDSGSSFKSREFRDFCSKHRIWHKMAAPHHQSSNGLVERCIGTLLQRLRKMAHAEDASWRSVWKRAIDIYNSTPHSITGMSPVELRFSKADGGVFKGSALHQARKEAIRKTRMARDRWAQGRQQRWGRAVRFRVGEKVLLYTKDRGSNRGKFDKDWAGPYIIIGKPVKRHYEIRHITSGLKQFVHGDQIARFLESPEVRAHGSVS